MMVRYAIAIIEEAPMKKSRIALKKVRAAYILKLSLKAPIVTRTA